MFNYVLVHVDKKMPMLHPYLIDLVIPCFCIVDTATLLTVYQLWSWSAWSYLFLFKKEKRISCGMHVCGFEQDFLTGNSAVGNPGLFSSHG
ncbi:hypothetical protein NC652_009936 [Populus alba x Populus x berolinensis]|nr:hypothetical protein NC652_009936 [Populus alba x Populus x berolinensis]